MGGMHRAGGRVMLQGPHSPAEGYLRSRIIRHVADQQDVVAVEGVEEGLEIGIRDFAGDAQAGEFGAEAGGKRTDAEGGGHEILRCGDAGRMTGGSL